LGPTLNLIAESQDKVLDLAKFVYFKPSFIPGNLMIILSISKIILSDSKSIAPAELTDSSAQFTMTSRLSWDNPGLEFFHTVKAMLWPL
jgi:hypothetical protein